jgi:hypothetical protein
MKIEEILNQREKTEIQKLINNPILKEAVKKVLLYELYYCGRLKAGEEVEMTNFAIELALDRSIPPSNLGIDLKISAEAIKLLEKGFDNIDKFKEEKAQQKDNKNPAR